MFNHIIGTKPAAKHVAARILRIHYSSEQDFMATLLNEFKLKAIMLIEYSEYKGHKIIVLKRDEESKFPFSFGKNKARLIVENYEAIKAFAEEKEETETENKQTT